MEDCLYGKGNNCPYLNKCPYETGEGVFPVDFERKGFYTPSEIFDMFKKLEQHSIVWTNEGKIIGCLPFSGRGKTVYSEKLEKIAEEFKRSLLKDEGD